jgi:putative nucleotidyltransferase with HDIG domain
MDVLDSKGQIVGASADAHSAPKSGGFIAWLRKLVFGVPAKRSPDRKAATRNPTQSEPADFVIAPGGYRVRIPSKDTDRSTDQAIPAIQEALASVPPLPHVVLGLIQEVQKPSSSAASVAELAGTDPALSSALLRTVNSAAFGVMRKVTTVSDAVSLLGFANVRSIVVKSRLAESLPRSAAGAAAAETIADTRDFWIHCLAVSYIADALCQRIPGVNRGFASTLGLLHDIGKLAIVARLGSYAPPSNGANEALNSREIRAWGIDHAGLGAALAHHWSLPADVVQAIRWHHRPERAFEQTDPAPLRKAAYVVQVANELAKYVYPYADEIELDPGAQAACSVLGFDHPIANLMDAPLRTVVTRAILFGFEDSNGALPRRFIRLRRPGDPVPPIGIADGHSLGRIRVDKGLLESAFEYPAERFTAPATAQGVSKLINSVEKHHAPLNVSPATRPLVLFTLRALLNNLMDQGAKPANIEITQRIHNGKLNVAVRADALAFTYRLGDQRDFGARILESELTSVLNLNWFESIAISPDGRAILFTTR